MIQVFSAGREVKYDRLTFSGGETHIRFLPNAGGVGLVYDIVARISNGDDMMALALIGDALRRMRASYISCLIPYFPYARQDRVMEPGESLSLKVAAGIVNGIGFDRVSVYDPHSDVTPALIEKCEIISNHGLVDIAIERMCEDFHLEEEGMAIVSPDAGSAKKIYPLLKALDFQGSLILGHKNRSTVNGKITDVGYQGVAEGKACVIVDDICDGGRTFVELAKVLRAGGANEVFLVVSHGIFSQGSQLEGIDWSYTTDSIVRPDEQGLTKFSIRNELQYANRQPAVAN